jgi:hypothetical protein
LQFEITKSNHTRDTIQQVHRQLSNSLRRQAEDIQRLVQSRKSLQNERRQLEPPACQLRHPLQRSRAGQAGTDTRSSSCVPSCFRRLAAAICLGQVLGALAEGATRIGARASAFNLRGRMAWGTSAVGYRSEPSGNDLCDPLRALKGASAAIESAPGSRYPESPSEQPAGDEAHFAPEQAIPVLLGTGYPGPSA